MKMNSNYRQMMEQITLDDEFRACLLEKIEASRPRSLTGKHIRCAVLIAACICLALTGAAFAAEFVFGISLRDVVSSTSFSGYGLQLDIGPWSMEQFSQELQDDLAAGQLNSQHDSWQSAAEYLGLPLLNNPLLDSAEQDSGWSAAYLVDHSLSVSNEHIPGKITQPELIRLSCGRVIGNVNISVAAFAYTEHADLSHSVFGFGWEDPAHAQKFSSELYKMENGDTAAIVTMEATDPTRKAPKEYQAYFVHENILYKIIPHSVHDGSKPYSDFLTVIKQVLNQF